MKKRITWCLASRALWLVVCFVGQVGFSQAQSTTLLPDHPRIFLNRESLRQVANQCSDGGIMQPSYQSLLNWVEEHPMKLGTAYFPRAYADAKFGFLYLVETELGRDGSRFVRHIKDVCWKADGTGIDGMNFGWDAVLYDWIYDALTVEERTIYGNRIGSFLLNYTDVSEITLEHGTYWYNQTWGPTLGTSWCRDGIAPKTMVALAIAGEQTDRADDAQRWLDSFSKRMPEEFVAKFDLLGGIWPEGPNHGNVTYAPYITWEAWHTATGEDLFKKVARTGFHREAPYWSVYGTVPHPGHMPHIQDVGPGIFREMDNTLFRAMHASHYRDGITQGQVQSAIDSGQAGWADMLGYDASVPVVKQEALPLAYHFRGSGHVYMRSGWQGADDTWSLFTASPYYTSYGNGQEGTGMFQITKQGTLAGNAGYQFGTSAYIPDSQNVVLVYDPQERYFSTGNEEVPWNDGGPQTPNFYHALTPVPRGEIVAFEHSDNYTYAAADITRAYSSIHDDEPTKQRTHSQKMRSFTRQFVYVRGNPEFFVIYDRVSATDAQLPKTWLLHLQGEPEILAGEGSLDVIEQGAGFKTYQGASGLLSRVASRDGKYWTTHKRGALGIRTLLPKEARITVRGGKDFDTWGNPHNPYGVNRPDPEVQLIQSDIDICLWRLEVEPATPSEEHHFLHVLVPYADATGKKTSTILPQPEAFKLVEDGTYEGVSLDTAEGSWQVLFQRLGALGGTVAIRRGEKPPFASSLATEVNENVTPAGLAIMNWKE